MTDVIVETTAGKLRGTIANSIHRFVGIPYGGPTGAHQRFRPPTRKEPWPGVRDALEYGNRAPQPAEGMAGLRAIIGEAPPEPEGEDCLFLNVWTPAVGDGSKRPVLFWCHGGGFTENEVQMPPRFNRGMKDFPARPPCRMASPVVCWR